MTPDCELMMQVVREVGESGGELALECWCLAP